MSKTFLVLFSCIMAPAAMAAVLTWFFRRLKAIQRERWGDKT